MHEFMKKKEEIHASFDVTLQATEVMAIVHGQYSIKMEKNTLDL